MYKYNNQIVQPIFKANMRGRRHGYTFHHLKCDQAGYVQWDVPQEDQHSSQAWTSQHDYFYRCRRSLYYIRYGVIKLFGEYFQWVATLQVWLITPTYHRVLLPRHLFYNLTAYKWLDSTCLWPVLFIKIRLHLCVPIVTLTSSCQCRLKANYHGIWMKLLCSYNMISRLYNIMYLSCYKLIVIQNLCSPSTAIHFASTDTKRNKKKD